MERDEVYNIIDTEREYQKLRWKEIEDERWTPTDWLMFIERYIKIAMDETLTAESVEQARNNQMSIIRKIAALAVAAMEYNVTPLRIF